MLKLVIEKESNIKLFNKEESQKQLIKDYEVFKNLYNGSERTKEKFLSKVTNINYNYPLIIYKLENGRTLYDRSTKLFNSFIEILERKGRY